MSPHRGKECMAFQHGGDNVSGLENSGIPIVP